MAKIISMKESETYCLLALSHDIWQHTMQNADKKSYFIVLSLKITRYNKYSTVNQSGFEFKNEHKRT